ncbi:MAG: hypothetical protein Q8K37_04105 [Alphaproteobacteria bacterium]|nr:hypothetical protein [Alphaproteobacteria bacterium]
MAIATNLQKFNFALSFDEILTEDQLEIQRKEELSSSFKKGHLQGIEEGEKIGYQNAQESIEAETLKHLSNFSQELTLFFEKIDEKRDENARLSLDLIKLIGKKFFLTDDLNDKINLIEKGLHDVLPLLIEEEKIVLNLEDTLIEPFSKRLQESNDYTNIINRLNFSAMNSKENLIGCIQWKKGEIDINPEHLWQKISEIFDNYQQHLSQQTGIHKEITNE